MSGDDRERREDFEQDDEWQDAAQAAAFHVPTADAALSDTEIEKLYVDARGRLSLEVRHLLVVDIAKHLQDMINMKPSYQRRLCWQQKKQSRLIESLLMNIPIPPVFVYEHEFAEYEVMDGQQRLEAIRSFLANEFSLSGLNHWACLNGRSWAELPATIQAGLRRCSLSMVVVHKESARSPEEAERLRRTVFERLNTYGIKLNAQELRNCLYYGRFNKLLCELSSLPAFRRAWGIPADDKRALDRNPMYRRMLDDELVLRFFAFSADSNIRGSVKATLDDYMQARMAVSEDEIEVLRTEFTTALDIALEVFGEDAFWLPQSDLRERRARSKPLFDAVLVAIHRVVAGQPKRQRSAAAGKLRSAAHVIRRDTRKALMTPADYELIVNRANTREGTLHRLRRVREIIGRAAGFEQ